MKIYVDVGHGGTDPGAVVSGVNEKDLNLSSGLEFEKYATSLGNEVVLSRSGDTDTTLEGMVDFANKWPADVFIGLHADSASNPDASGFYVIKSIKAAEGSPADKIAKSIVAWTTKTCGMNTWGQAVRVVESKVTKGTDYYYTIRNAMMPSFIIERGFMTNQTDLQKLRDPIFVRLQALGIALGIHLAAGGIVTPILGVSSSSAQVAKAWARSRGATPTFIALADLYWRIAPAAGVIPEVAYCQSAKETAFGRFTGVVKEDFCNPCGLKTSLGGANDDPNAHARFPDWETGVKAHVDHLALYAGAPGYPKAGSPDPRHFPSIAGTAPYVETLGGRWAPSLTYGQSIVKDYLATLYSFKLDENDEKYEELKQQLDAVQERLCKIETVLNELALAISDSASNLGTEVSKAVQHLKPPQVGRS